MTLQLTNQSCSIQPHLREALVKSLINSDAGIRVDSVSKCLHNAEVPSGLDSMSSKKSIMSRYLFYLAFENQCEDDYITEKVS